MKLFQSLLVAPAALGLLAPMSVTANELNITDVTGYSSSEEVESISDFDPAKELAVTNSRVDGLEARLNEFEAGSFSDTTTASFSADFLIGAVDGHTSSEATSTGYGFQIDLSTSFTGEDVFAVSLDAGAGAAQLAEADLNSSGDGLIVDGISYQFPVGDKTQVVVGDSIDGSTLFSTACVYGGFTNTLDDCGNASSAIAGASATTAAGDTSSVGASVSYDIGGGWTAAAGYNGEGTSTDGLLTHLGQDLYAAQVAYTADSYGISLTMANVESTTLSTTATNEYYADTTYYAVNGYWTPEETGVVPSISVGFENGNVEADQSGSSDTNQWFVGFQWDEAGPGVLGVAAGSAGAQATDNAEDLSQYEIFYSYPLNDGVTITPAIYILETADTATASVDDITGVMVKTSFSF